jgi:hypothetical protein
MATEPSLKEPAFKPAGAERRRTASRPWWDGRQVAIRPDVPGRDFDAGDLVLVRTDEERDQINAGIDRYVAEQEGNKSDNELDDWLGKD